MLTATNHGLRKGNKIELFGEIYIVDKVEAHTLTYRLPRYWQFYEWIKRPFVNKFPEWVY